MNFVKKKKIIYIYVYIYHRHQAKQFVTIKISKHNIQILEDGASGVQGDIE
jgi:hypothetical protein